MSTITQAFPLTAAQVYAAAIAADTSGHDHPITAAERYAGALTDDLPTLNEGSSITITNTVNGTTVNGEKMADWVADLSANPKMNNAGTTVATAKTQPADTATLSPQATALLERQKIALAVIAKADPSTVPPNANAQTTGTKQTSTAAAAATPTTTTTASSLFPSAAGFQAEYATQLADGPAGRFYNSTEPQIFAMTMSQDEYASFQAAFDSHTLVIQSAADTPGVQFTGSYSTTFTETAIGGGEYSRGGQVLDMTAFMNTTKYAMVGYDPFFGPTIISWGGPPDSTPASASSTQAA